MEKGNKGHLKGERGLEKWNRPAKKESVLEDGAELVVVGCGESVPELGVKLTPASSAPALAASSGNPVPVVGDLFLPVLGWAETQKSSLCLELDSCWFPEPPGHVLGPPLPYPPASQHCPGNLLLPSCLRSPASSC